MKMGLQNIPLKISTSQLDFQMSQIYFLKNKKINIPGKAA